VVRTLGRTVAGSRRRSGAGLGGRSPGEAEESGGGDHGATADDVPARQADAEHIVERSVAGRVRTRVVGIELGKRGSVGFLVK
jgi:hypothetical protein